MTVDSSLEIFIHVLSSKLTRSNELKAKEELKALKIKNKGQKNIPVLPTIASIGLEDLEDIDVIIGDGNVWLSYNSEQDLDQVNPLSIVNKGWKRKTGDKIRKPSEASIRKKKRRKTILRLDDPRFFGRCLPSAICLAYLEKHWKLNLDQELHEIGKIARKINSESSAERESAIEAVLQYQNQLFSEITIDGTLENSLDILGLACKSNIIIWTLDRGSTRFVTKFPQDGFKFEWPVLSLLQEIQECANNETYGHISVIQYIRSFFDDQGNFCFCCNSVKKGKNTTCFCKDKVCMYVFR